MVEESNALAFETLGEPPGVEVIDRIEQQRYSIHTPEAVSLREVPTNGFQFPVGQAVTFEATEFTILTAPIAFIRDESGQMLAEVDHQDEISLPAGNYCLELSAQIKTYVEFEAQVTVSSDPSGTTVKFRRPTAVRLGVRSRHERPAGTVTTTSEPADIMAAIETFGSALKTLNPERSYPTLRGHPPAIELGAELDIPEGLESPNTGITLELPPRLGSLYVAAPLAYYLGASIESGAVPRLVTDDGFEYDLDGPEGFETRVGNTLQQLFLLDCVTRTEGFANVSLHERRQIEPLLDFDIAQCYNKPLAEQVATYLEVPFSVIEDQVPEWPLATHMAPVAESVEQLPFVAVDLALIHSADSSYEKQQPSQATDDDVLTRSVGTTTSESSENFVQPSDTDAVEQAWIGEDIPIGASKLTTEAFRNRLDREVTDGDIEIAIVVNDERMDAERDIVDRVYGDRDDLPFDVTLYRNTSIAELRELLGCQRGFLHYIGHTEHDGFNCSDGKLDAANLENVGIESFLLNACSSYNQGLHLIEAGAIGGIVTLTDIINDEAVAIGESVARLLNEGFPLRASLNIAREESIQGGQYIVAGDGSMSVAQAEGRIPHLVEIERDEDGFSVNIRTFTTQDAALGTIYTPYLRSADSYYLGSGDIDTFSVSRHDLQEFFELGNFPIRAGGDLKWSSSVSVDDLFGPRDDRRGSVTSK